VLDVGARLEPRSQSGVATLTAAAMAEGTTRLDAAALADEFERLGGSLSSYATWDATHVRTTVLSSRLRDALSLLAEVLRTPSFAPREVNRLKEERLAELLELKTEPRGLADERFTSSLYRSDSRFSVQEGGSERTVTPLTVDLCRAWHSAKFAPSVTALVLAGDVNVDEALQLATENLLPRSSTTRPYGTTPAYNFWIGRVLRKQNCVSATSDCPGFIRTTSTWWS
jgi:predicted Zn-dependent peptidase